MARATLLALLLCATCLAAARAAGENGYTRFLADTLVNARFGTPAKTTDYYGYGSETEIACLSQQNFRSCRLTECAAGNTCEYYNFFVQ